MQNQLDKRELSALSTFITYAESKSEMLSNFYDVQSLLLEKMESEPQMYKAKEIVGSPLSNGKIKKGFDMLDRKYVKKKMIVDATKDEGAVIPEKVRDYFGKFSCKQTVAETYVQCHFDMVCDIYMNIPRENKVNLHKISVTEGTEFGVQNIFNLYGSEKFVLAFRGEEIALSIVASAQGAVKGSGEIFLYAMTEDCIYKDVASKYFDVQPLLGRFRG